MNDLAKRDAETKGKRRKSLGRTEFVAAIRQQAECTQLDWSSSMIWTS